MGCHAVEISHDWELAASGYSPAKGGQNHEKKIFHSNLKFSLSGKYNHVTIIVTWYNYLIYKGIVTALNLWKLNLSP